MSLSLPVGAKDCGRPAEPKRDAPCDAPDAPEDELDFGICCSVYVSVSLCNVEPEDDEEDRDYRNDRDDEEPDPLEELRDDLDNADPADIDRLWEALPPELRPTGARIIAQWFLKMVSPEDDDALSDLAKAEDWHKRGAAGDPTEHLDPSEPVDFRARCDELQEAVDKHSISEALKWAREGLAELETQALWDLWRANYGPRVDFARTDFDEVVVELQEFIDGYESAECAPWGDVPAYVPDDAWEDIIEMCEASLAHLVARDEADAAALIVPARPNRPEPLRPAPVVSPELPVSTAPFVSTEPPSNLKPRKQAPMSTVPFIKTLTTQVKTATPRTYNLGQYTLILGVNGAGKTSISQAVSLLLSGATDLGPRQEIKDPRSVAALGGPQGFQVSGVVQQGDFNLDRSYTLTAETDDKGGVHYRADVLPAADPSALPYNAVRAMLAGAGETREKTILGWTKGVTDVEVLQKIDVDYHAEYKALVGDAQGEPLTVLLNVIDRVGRTARASKVEVEAQQAERDRWLGVRAPPTNLAEQQHARDTWWRLEQEGRYGVARGADLWDTVVARATAASQAPAAVAYWQQQLAEIDQQLAAFTPIQEALPVIDRYAAGGDAQIHCPCCYTPTTGANLAAVGAWYRTHLEAAGALVIAQGQARAALNAWAPLVQDPAPRHLQELAISMPILSSVLVALPTFDAEITKATLDAGVYTTAAARAEEARVAANAAKAAGERAEALVTVLTTARKALLDSALQGFAQRAQAYMPAGYVLRMIREDGVLTIGLEIQGRPVATDLSGRERVLLEVALACALVEAGVSTVGKKKGRTPVKNPGVAQNGPPPLRVILPREIGWSPAELAQTMRAWSSFPGQVILESTVAPKGRLPEGWTVVEIEGPGKVEEKVEEKDDREAHEAGRAVAGGGTDTPSTESYYDVLTQRFYTKDEWEAKGKSAVPAPVPAQAPAPLPTPERAEVQRGVAGFVALAAPQSAKLSPYATRALPELMMLGYRLEHVVGQTDERLAAMLAERR